MLADWLPHPEKVCLFELWVVKGCSKKLVVMFTVPGAVRQDPHETDVRSIKENEPIVSWCNLSRRRRMS